MGTVNCDRQSWFNMTRKSGNRLVLLFVLNAMVLVCVAQQPTEKAATAAGGLTAYVIGTQDEVSVRVLDFEEITAAPVRVDLRGDISLPMVGRVHAAGLTVEQLEADLKTKLSKYLLQPEVTVTLTAYRSQPVLVLGSVKTPGSIQLEGRKTLFEVISLAGGIAPDAGYTIKITRKKENGRIPLVGATDDPTGQYSIADVSVKAVLEAKNPEENIMIMPNDTITVPRGTMIYVIGAVKKTGGFVLGDNESISILQALSLADGLDKMASPKEAKILRLSPGSATRTEIPVDVKKIFEGKANDVPLGSEDILFVPNSKSKSAAMRAAELGIGLGTSALLYGLIIRR